MIFSNFLMSILFGRTNTGEGRRLRGVGGKGHPHISILGTFVRLKNPLIFASVKFMKTPPMNRHFFLVQIMFPKKQGPSEANKSFYKKSNLCSDNSAVISRDQKRNCICLITDPSSVQDACHVNFVIDHTHSGVSVSQW